MVKNLKKLRTEHHLSQLQLAVKIGVTQQSINKYENHKAEPDIYTLIKLADYFHTSVDYLIGHTEIDRIIENVQFCDLNDKEYDLVESYRSLSDSRKAVVMALLRSYGDNE